MLATRHPARTRRLPSDRAGPARCTLHGVYLGGVARHQELRDQTRPAGLMCRADAPPGVAVEVFIEEYVVAEVRVVEGALAQAMDRPTAVRIREEQPCQARGEIVGHLVDGEA